MKYISVEQFKEQPKKVQEVLLKWWSFKEGDLFLYKEEYSKDPFYVNVNACNVDLESNIEGDFKWLKPQVIPLFTEGQLREFIEDKTRKKMDISFYPENEGYECVGYTMQLFDYVTCLREFDNLGNDLLQAYWKVACQIVEEVQNEN